MHIVFTRIGGDELCILLERIEFLYIYKVSSFAFASDEQRRALNFHEISIDSLLNSNKLFVAVFCMYASDANEKKNVLTVHKKKSVTA